MSVEELIAELEAAVPIKRQVNVEGWPRPVWIWKLTTEQLLELNTFPRGTPKEVSAYSLRLLAYCLGDENAPAGFGSASGQAWLSRQPMAVIELTRAAQQFNELHGPNDDRKKKSETTSACEPCSTSAVTCESDTLDD